MLAAVLGGLGVALYAGLWLVLPTDSHFETRPPGIESATRGGRRPGRIRRLTDVGPAIALAALGFGAILLLEAVLGQGARVLAGRSSASVGIALLWRQADEAQRERWLDTTGRIDPVRVVLGSGGWASYARLAAGVGLIVIALVLLLVPRRVARHGPRRHRRRAARPSSGSAIVVGPWVFRLASDLTAERAERVRTQERADVAAHLHDSVLQTLALIQKNADDGPTVARLARVPGARPAVLALRRRGHRRAARVASALRGVAAEVEDAHGVVGRGRRRSATARLTEALRPVVQRHPRGGHQRRQARRHRPGRRVRRGHRRGGRRVRPRPRAAASTRTTIAEDRYGVRNSIIDRMDRHGGTAEVRSTPGEGTEVRLHLPRQQEENDD